MNNVTDQLPGKWVDYQPHCSRDKEYYDIMLRDGEIVECCYPNGIGWYPMHPEKPSKHGRLPDYRVLRIRRCKHPMDYKD